MKRWRGNVIDTGEYTREQIEAQYPKGCGLALEAKGEYLYMDNAGFVQMDDLYPNCVQCGKWIIGDYYKNINWVYFCPLCAAESGWVW